MTNATDATHANQQFNDLWEAVATSRLIIGDEDKGVEIVLDIDLSPTGILKQLREISRSGHKEGLIDDNAHQEMEKSTSELEKAVTHAIPDAILNKVWPLLGRR